MELKNGYKNSDIGIIPEDWNVIPYGKVFEFLNTATYSRAELVEDDEVKYIHYGDIHSKWRFHLDLSQYELPSIPKLKLKHYSLIKDGDVVMADASEDYSGIGKSIEIKNVGNLHVIAGLHTFLMRDKNSILVNGYRGYLHSITSVKRQFDELATGMKVYGVSKANLRNVLIPYPKSEAEQTAIASALSNMDNLIAGLEQLIAKKKAIKQGAMQELLRPKEGWVVKKLGDHCMFYSGGTPSTSNSSFYGGDIKWITSSDLNKTLIDDVDGRITEAGLRNSSAKMVDKGALLVALYGATAGVTAITNIEAAINQAVLAIIPKKDNTLFLFYCLTNLKNWIISTFIQGGQGNLSGNIFKELELSMPDSYEQERIASILRDMDDEIILLEKNLEKSKMLKQGMMQELLTGKTRLV